MCRKCTCSWTYAGMHVPCLYVAYLKIVHASVFATFSYTRMYACMYVCMYVRERDRMYVGSPAGAQSMPTAVFVTIPCRANFRTSIRTQTEVDERD